MRCPVPRAQQSYPPTRQWAEPMSPSASNETGVLRHRKCTSALAAASHPHSAARPLDASPCCSQRLLQRAFYLYSGLSRPERRLRSRERERSRWLREERWSLSRSRPESRSRERWRLERWRSRERLRSLRGERERLRRLLRDSRTGDLRAHAPADTSWTVLAMHAQAACACTCSQPTL